jgi:alpha-N-arabinofuranosidase
VNGKNKIPALNVSASKDSNQVVHMTLVNLDPKNVMHINTALNEVDWTKVEGMVLTSAKLTDVNTFNQPNSVKPVVFNGAKKVGNELVVDLPAQSIVLLTLKK